MSLTESEQYGVCYAALLFTPEGQEAMTIPHVDIKCSGHDAIDKIVPVCYNRWHPTNVVINDSKLAPSICGEVGYDSAWRCIWFSVAIYTCSAIFYAVIGVNIVMTLLFCPVS